MDIKIKCFERSRALAVLNKNPSAHIDYFYEDGSVDLTINKAIMITSNATLNIYRILSDNGYCFDFPYLSYREIVIC